MFEKSLKNAPHFLTYVLVNSAFFTYNVNCNRYKANTYSP